MPVFIGCLSITNKQPRPQDQYKSAPKTMSSNVLHSSSRTIIAQQCARVVPQRVRTTFYIVLHQFYKYFLICAFEKELYSFINSTNFFLSVRMEYFGLQCRLPAKFRRPLWRVWQNYRLQLLFLTPGGDHNLRLPPISRRRETINGKLRHVPYWVVEDTRCCLHKSTCRHGCPWRAGNAEDNDVWRSRPRHIP